MKRFGDWLSESRKRKGMTSVEVSSIVGINQSSLSRFENGIASPLIETAIKLMNALGENSLSFHEFKTEMSFRHSEEYGKDYPTYEDLDNFGSSFRKNQALAKKFLEDWVWTIHKYYQPDFDKRLYPFLLSDSQLKDYANNERLKKFAILFPRIAIYDTQRKIFDQGGVILRQDALPYFLDLTKYPQISDEIWFGKHYLQLLSPSGLFSLRISDIEDMEEKTGEETILAFLLRGAEFDARINAAGKFGIHDPNIEWWLETENFYDYLIVILSRWLNFINASSQQFISELRSISNNFG